MSEIAQITPVPIPIPLKELFLLPYSPSTYLAVNPDNWVRPEVMADIHRLHDLIKQGPSDEWLTGWCRDEQRKVLSMQLGKRTRTSANKKLGRRMMSLYDQMQKVFGGLSSETSALTVGALPPPTTVPFLIVTVFDPWIPGGDIRVKSIHFLCDCLDRSKPCERLGHRSLIGSEPRIRVAEINGPVFRPCVETFYDFVAWFFGTTPAAAKMRVSRRRELEGQRVLKYRERGRRKTR